MLRSSVENIPVPQGLSLQGFRFAYRNGMFQWRLLHGIDVDSVVRTLAIQLLRSNKLMVAPKQGPFLLPRFAQIRLTDVRAIEDCLDTLQHGSFENEKGLSCKNCIQLFRLLQLAIEYVWHLRNAHTALLEHYNAATAAAER